MLGSSSNNSPTPTPTPTPADADAQMLDADADACRCKCRRRHSRIFFLGGGALLHREHRVPPCARQRGLLGASLRAAATSLCYGCGQDVGHVVTFGRRDSRSQGPYAFPPRPPQKGSNLPSPTGVAVATVTSATRRLPLRPFALAPTSSQCVRLLLALAPSVFICRPRWLSGCAGCQAASMASPTRIQLHRRPPLGYHRWGQSTARLMDQKFNPRPVRGRTPD
jgi:hypothetical protein